MAGFARQYHLRWNKMKKDKINALTVLLVATLINILNGMLYTWSSISSRIISDWGWTSKQASLPYTMHTIFFVIAMVIFGNIQDKKGPRGIATIGSVLLGLGFILSGFTTSPFLILLTIGVVVGSGIGMHTVTTGPTAIKWFPASKKGLITGIVASGAALSSLLYSPIGKYLLDNEGINKTFIYIGLGVLILTTLSSQLLKSPTSANQSEKPSTGQDIISYDWRYMLRDKTFHKFWIMKSFSASAGLMIISHIATIASVQANLTNGYLLIIILSIFNSLGRVFGGMISDKIGRVNLMKIVFLLQGTNMALFNSYKSIISLIFGVVVVGFCYGAGVSVFPSAISDKYGPKYYGQNFGLMFTAWGFGGIIGPMTAATIYDATGNYSLAYIIAFSLMSISLMITFTFKKSNNI